MQVSEVNEKLNNLEHRINKIKQRIELQKVGPEVETARKILYGFLIIIKLKNAYLK